MPIISDEIYADMVFGSAEFTPMAAFSMKVPVLTVGGISKRWLAPGWRLGWIIVADPKGILARGKVSLQCELVIIRTQLYLRRFFDCCFVELSADAFIIYSEFGINIIVTTVVSSCCVDL